MSDSTGQTVIIAATAGVVFAAFLAFTPRLTASQTVERDVAAVSGADAVDGFDADPAGQEAALEESGDEDVGNEIEPSIGCSLTMTVELLGPREGYELATIEDEGTAEWSLRITNSGTEMLHGVHVYVEGAGQASCDTSYLRPGNTAQ